MRYRAPEFDLASMALATAPVGVSYQSAVPQLFARCEDSAKRTFEFLAANIRNRNTRRAYARGVSDFGQRCAQRNISDIAQVQPVHVAAYIETLKPAASIASTIRP